MSGTVWTVNAYDDPYVSPHLVGVFESLDALTDAARHRFRDIEFKTDDEGQQYFVVRHTVFRRTALTERYEIREVPANGWVSA